MGSSISRQNHEKYSHMGSSISRQNHERYSPMGSSISRQNHETASALQVETEIGSHLFKVSRYSLTKGIGAGKCYQSGVFTVGGYNWAIRYYPDGDLNGKEFISVFLQVKSDVTNVRAQCTFAILQKDGVPSDISCTTGVCTFKTNDQTWGFPKFVERNKFEASRYLIDDAFTLKCTVTIVKGTNLEVTNSDAVTIPPSNLNQHFVNLLESEDGADITFEVNGERFKAHRYILAARSAVFRAKFYGGMKEKRSDTITIADIEAQIFKSMLYFIYTDSVPDFEGSSDVNSEKRDVRLIAQHLLVAADRYDLERLRLICEELLCKFLDVNTVATTLVLAEQHNCSQLKVKCLKFLSCPNVLKAVTLTDGFQHLMKSCPSIFE